jgi:CRISPR-associated protein Csy1
MTTSNGSAAIRSAVLKFLSDRRDGKIKALKDDDPDRDEKLAGIHNRFDFHTWLSDAADRAHKIQVVTHSLKQIHSAATGTNLYCPPSSLPTLNVVGSHCLGEIFAEDTVCDAKDLDVWAFLKLEFDGQSLFNLMRAGVDVATALSDQPEQAAKWVEAFTGLVQTRGQVASHRLAKQVYWLVGEDPATDVNFHLLAPLYASSLAHRVHIDMQEWTSEPAKEARKAYRNKQFHERPVRFYPDLAVQKLGGTKPQNISQLNSERRGNNYLFASLPPVWQMRDLAPLLHADTLFKRFERQDGVWQSVKALRDYLESNPPKTMDTSDTRDELAFELIAQFVHFGVVFRTLPEGWSTEPECRLHASEKVWVDAGAAVERPSDWADQLARRYANWLNGQLSSKQRLHMGDPEHQHWQVDLAEELAAYEWEMSHAE